MTTLKSPTKTKILIVGKGKVGSSIGKMIETNDDYELQYEDPFKHIFVDQDFNPDIIHITIPLYDRESFLSDMQRVINRFIISFKHKDLNFYDRRKIVIIDSTIILGIIPVLQNNFKEFCDFVYSPVRATDSNMEIELKTYQRYFAVADNENTDLIKEVEEYYSSIGLSPLQFKDTEALVMGKLASVGWYTMNISYTQQLAEICSQHNIDFDEAYTIYNKNEKIGHKYNAETKQADYLMDRPIFFPGIIEGNCCIQDTVLMLREQYGDASFWRWIIQSNEKRKRFINDNVRVIENNNTIEPITNLKSDD